MHAKAVEWTKAEARVMRYDNGDHALVARAHHVVVTDRMQRHAPWMRMDLGEHAKSEPPGRQRGTRELLLGTSNESRSRFGGGKDCRHEHRDVRPFDPTQQRHTLVFPIGIPVGGKPPFEGLDNRLCNAKTST